VLETNEENKKKEFFPQNRQTQKHVERKKERKTDLLELIIRFVVALPLFPPKT
jgi:hypothetical protein